MLHRGVQPGAWGALTSCPGALFPPCGLRTVKPIQGTAPNCGRRTSAGGPEGAAHTPGWGGEGQAAHGAPDWVLPVPPTLATGVRVTGH